MNEKNLGFTLIELVIVLAIVAIIGAILIPNFINTTDRARLRSDVQSARILQNALELYNVEQPNPMALGTAAQVIEQLDRLGYVEARRVVEQTTGANFSVVSGRIVLDISGASDSIRALYSMLSEQERRYVSGGISN